MATNLNIAASPKRVNTTHFIIVGVVSLVGLYVTAHLLHAMEAGQLSWSNLVSLIGGCGLIYYSYQITRDLLAPPTLISCIWSFTLFLATFDVQYLGPYAVFNFQIYPSTWVILISSILAFLAGSVVATAIRRSGNYARAQYTYDNRRIRLLIYGSFGIAALGYAVCYLAAGTAPILVDYLNEVRTSFRVSGYGLLMTLFMVTIALSAYICGSTGVIRNWKLVVLSLASFACMLSTTERADSFQTFVVGSISYFLSRRYAIKTKAVRSSFITSAVPVVVSCGLLTAAFLYVGSARAAGDRGVAATKIVDVENDLLAQLYIYSYVPSIKNLQWGTEQRIDFAYGLILARPLLWMVGKLEWLPEDVDFGGVNTVTWLWNYYRDFGYLGVIAIPFALGFISTLVYWLTVQQPSIQSVTIYGLIVSCIIWTTGTERFFETMTFIYAILLLSAGYFCQVRVPLQRTSFVRG